MRHDMREQLAGYDVCPDCYMAFHYGPHGAGPTWDRDRYGETVNSWAEQGYRVYDGVDRDTDTGYTVFSKQACETCGDHLAGERYRLLVG